jgi:ATP-binding protein involved in chromosome partitioning
MKDEKVVPMEAHGVKLMSLGFLVGEETPAVWRGPIVMGIVRQFLHQVDWGELDYLIVDLPPGTGDAQLSLVQLVRVSGAVMVATPQDVAVTGALKGIKMFESLDVPVLGIVENMRGFACPDCNSMHDIFGSGGAETLARTLEIPFLGAVPLGMAVREEGDRGEPTVIGRSESAEGKALAGIAMEVAGRIDEMAGQPAAS